jgi:hypothetical protein
MIKESSIFSKAKRICASVLCLALLLSIGCTPITDQAYTPPDSAAPDNVPYEAPKVPATELLTTPDPMPTPTPSPTPEPEPEMYSYEWLMKYSPAACLPFADQIGDNGDYDEVTQWPEPGKYKLVVELANQAVSAYEKDESGEHTKLVRVMICTTGGNGNATPRGTFTMGEHRLRFGFFVNFDCYAQYWTQIVRNIYFHSILYTRRSASEKTLIRSSYKNLGRTASHGCVRMLAPDAHWIFVNCGPGTTVDIVRGEKDQQLKDALKYGGGTNPYTPKDKMPDIPSTFSLEKEKVEPKETD